MKPTILVVDDDSDLVRGISRLLKQEGYQVLTAPSPAEAIRIWGSRREQIRLLITDLNLNDPVTGVELAQVLSSEKPELNVLYISGDHAHFLGAQVEPSQFLAKPFFAADLLARIEELLADG